jgi:hypothetical protein
MARLAYAAARNWTTLKHLEFGNELTPFSRIKNARLRAERCERQRRRRGTRVRWRGTAPQHLCSVLGGCGLGGARACTVALWGDRRRGMDEML